MTNINELFLDNAVTPFVLYDKGNDKVCIKVFVHHETIWLSQRQLAELFQTTTDNISLHIKNIYLEEELPESGTTEDFSVVQNV